MASIGKSFGLKLYIHSMTDNIITTSNYTQLQLHCNCQDITEILLKVVLNKNFQYRVLLQIIHNLYIQYFYVMSEFV